MLTFTTLYTAFSNFLQYYFSSIMLSFITWRIDPFLNVRQMLYTELYPQLKYTTEMYLLEQKNLQISILQF